MPKTIKTIKRSAPDRGRRQNEVISHIFKIGRRTFNIHVSWDTFYDFQSRACLKEQTKDCGMVQTTCLPARSIRSATQAERELIDIARAMSA